MIIISFQDKLPVHVLKYGNSTNLCVSPGAGINDLLGSFLDAQTSKIDGPTVLSNIAAIVPCIVAAATTVLNNGEQNVILTTIAPAFVAPLATAFGLKGLLRNSITPMNAALKTAVQNLTVAFPLASVSLWDVSDVIVKLYNNGTSYGVTDVTDPCVVTKVDTIDPRGPPTLVSTCPDPSQYAFW